MWIERGAPLSWLVLAGLAACETRDHDVVLYCGSDTTAVSDVVQAFEDETGLRVATELGIDLRERLRGERADPRGDVVWDDALTAVVTLAEEGLLARYDPPGAADVPEEYRDPERRWTGLAGRTRVLVVNTELVPDTTRVASMWDFLLPQWAGKVGMARPVRGTALAHAGALYAALGEPQARKYLDLVRQYASEGRVVLTDGEQELVREVAAGRLAWGWSDTEAFESVRASGAPVLAIWPDQEGEPALRKDDQGLPVVVRPRGRGALVVPDAIALVEGAPNPEAARRLVDYLLSPAVEERLAHSSAARVPLRAGVPKPPHVFRPQQFHTLDLDSLELGREVAARRQVLEAAFPREPGKEPVR